MSFYYGYEEFKKISKELDAQIILTKALVGDNNRLRQTLEILTKDPCGFCCDCPDIREFCRAALEGKE